MTLNLRDPPRPGCITGSGQAQNSLPKATASHKPFAGRKTTFFVMLCLIRYTKCTGSRERRALTRAQRRRTRAERLVISSTVVVPAAADDESRAACPPPAPLPKAQGGRTAAARLSHQSSTTARPFSR
jgi:hypothetical protein